MFRKSITHSYHTRVGETKKKAKKRDTNAAMSRAGTIEESKTKTSGKTGIAIVGVTTIATNATSGPDELL